MPDVTSRPPGAGVAMHATFGPSLSLTGDVFAQQDLLVRGVIVGNLDLPEHALTIAEGARINGTVYAKTVVIAGEFTGELTASTRVQILAGAVVRGEVTCPRLVIEDEAIVQGKVDTKRTEAAMHVARYRLEKKLTAS